MKKPRFGKKIIIIGLILFFIFSMEFIPSFLFRLLENRIPSGHIPDGLDGIIVLVGCVDMRSSRPGLAELNEQADRIVAGIILAREFPEAKLIITGGSGNLKQDETLAEADYLKKLSISLGIDKGRLLIERSSRNTHEHAVAMAKLLSKNGRWALITSVFHMPRSFGCFNKKGLTTIPYPVDYKTKLDHKLSLNSFLPTLGNMNRLGIAMHEWLGLIAYRLTGYTDSLLPKID